MFSFLFSGGCLAAAAANPFQAHLNAAGAALVRDHVGLVSGSSTEKKKKTASSTPPPVVYEVGGTVSTNDFYALYMKKARAVVSKQVFKVTKFASVDDASHVDFMKRAVSPTLSSFNEAQCKSFFKLKMGELFATIKYVSSSACYVRV